MNKEKKISLLLMAHIISLSYVHAIRYFNDYISKNPYRNKHQTTQQQITPGSFKTPSGTTAVTQPQVVNPTVPIASSTTLQQAPVAGSANPAPLTPVVKSLNSVAEYKTKFKDVTGTGYTDGITATLVLANKSTMGNDIFSTSDIMDILEAAKAPLQEKDYTKRLRMLQQKNDFTNLLKAFLANIQGPEESRVHYKGKTLSNGKHFFDSDETKITKMLAIAENGPLTPPDLLDPQGAAYIDATAKSALTKYATYVQNPLYLNSMLKYLKVFFNNRATVSGCKFEASHSAYQGDYRFINQDMKEPVTALATVIKDVVINTAADYTKAGFSSRKDLISDANEVFDILKLRLADKAGYFSPSPTIKEYISELDKIKK